METFTLEQMSYIVEIIGVIAVAASLIYVGKQIQQNTKTMQVNAAGVQAQWLMKVFSNVTWSLQVNTWGRPGSYKVQGYDLNRITWWIGLHRRLCLPFNNAFRSSALSCHCRFRVL